MMRAKALVWTALLACLTAMACGSEDRPPRAGAGGSQPRTGGSTGRGGSGGGTAGSADPGGTGGSIPIPGGTACERFDPEKVYLLGSLTEGQPERSIALPERPTEVCSALIAAGPVLLDALTESVFYVHAEDQGLWAYRDDTYFLPPGSSTYQHDTQPHSNDEVVLEPCTDGELSVLVEPDTGSVWSSCDGETYLDRNGEPRAQGGATLLHLGRDGLALGLGVDGELVVVTRAGTALPANGCSGEPPVAVRAREFGFWVVTGNGSTLTLESVDDQAQCDRLGTYAPLPSGITAGLKVAIDAAGNAYQLGRDPADNDVVVRRAYPPGDSSVVYTEADAPVGGQDWENLRFYIRVDGGELFTGG